MDDNELEDFLKKKSKKELINIAMGLIKLNCDIDRLIVDLNLMRG